MKGMDEVRFYKKVIRKAIPGVRKPGLKVIPRPNEVFVHYLPAALKSTVKNIEKSLKPDQTTMVDIVLRRLVHEGVYELTTDLTADNFRKQKPKDIIG